ncbi:hypothetical protein CEUSTIGMA_g9278.t1 [Chlamydomonas eustigma]|uniref:Transcription initiation factor TFIID component TAF4 C-terminal domain-containing protein n=1 Tax=Chlamydomonas eustigma TaxID=1157962 RepID=A0A250XGD8_9CHLO|nr:hypothetical protein CEUSTIGMA_g9278.t1 [Chlamydomonas eustigma]|eukprot:GAX81850.1 hypothetical protein CEUSTIGMA_g9278.t1 [Chlamydomonas eustigma]
MQVVSASSGYITGDNAVMFLLQASISTSATSCKSHGASRYGSSSTASERISSGVQMVQAAAPPSQKPYDASAMGVQMVPAAMPQVPVGTAYPSTQNPQHAALQQQQQQQHRQNVQAQIDRAKQLQQQQQSQIQPQKLKNLDHCVKHLMSLPEEKRKEMLIQDPELKRLIQETLLQNKRQRTDEGVSAPDSATTASTLPSTLPTGTSTNQTARTADNDDITKTDNAVTDALAGVFNVEEEHEQLLSTVVKTAAFRPRVQEEHVLNQGPLLKKAEAVAHRHGLKGVDPTCFSYLAEAMETHLVGLLKAMSRVSAQRNDPSRDLPGMSRTGFNLKGALAAISRADRSLREQKAAAEQEKLLQQAASKSKKLGEEQKAQIQQAKEAKQKTQQLEGARNVLGGAFAFRKKGGGGLFGQKGGAKASGKKEGAGKGSGQAASKAAGKGEAAGGGHAKAAAAASGPLKTSAAQGNASVKAESVDNDLDDDEDEEMEDVKSDSDNLGAAAAAAAAAKLAEESMSTSGATPAAGSKPAGVAPPAVKTPSVTAGAAAGGRPNGIIVMTCKDLAAAMEKDVLLCRHPLLYRIHSEVVLPKLETTAPPPTA